VKKAKTTACTQLCFRSFTLWQPHVPRKKGEGIGRGQKCPAEKNPNRAGATPLFGLLAAQKVFGIAPGLGAVPGAAYFPAGPQEFRI
jgi:hypothetical protein